ncbi:arf-GAP with Rho-GAP domain, ANK repeat and PH domain-containing protein 1-like [Brienomyrus brachyistius]|uniref:arf-GAP with Rho-GAP domain, ANK repeat and PH domain-containing protein 1-like n=1 Tax=Brienomyrus brachyistius TaxID=42636 RepID=UPI0020B2D347|nr:arf-GAP with Rho-GAP domain, ANK repeat and PH domain-containing protein 1-like [Brienomyrus brachyistius]
MSSPSGDGQSPEMINRNNGSTKAQWMAEREDSIYLDSDNAAALAEGFASEATLPIKSGFLEKTPPQGGLPFQKRWVQLDAEYLRYFQNEKDVYSKRMIPISSMVSIVPAGPQKFEVATKNRTFVFRAQSESDRNEWLSLLQNMLQKRYSSAGMPPEPCSPVLMHGNLELRGVHSKLYVTVNEDKLILYRNVDEYKLGIGITSIQMKLGCVKDADKRAFNLVTPYRVFSFVAESMPMKVTWMKTIEFAISSALSTNALVNKVWAQESNRFCADCGAAWPEWASINLSVIICSNCAGQHRWLGSCVSKVRSLRLDQSVWTDELVQVFLSLGNGRANSFWAANVPPSEALSPFSHEEDRKSFIFAKYRQGKYRCYHKLFGQQKALDNALCSNVQTDDILETLSLLFCGADVNCNMGHSDVPSPISLARSYNQHLQVELLSQNQNTEVPRLEVEYSLDRLEESPALIMYSGNLYKMGSTTRPITEQKPREEFSFRWCILKNGKLSYGNFRSSTPSRQLSVEDVLCLSVDAPGKHGYEHTFEICTDSDRLYLFGDDDPDTVREWIRSITKAFLPANVQDLAETAFRRVGRLRYRVGLMQEVSRLGWFSLAGTKLYGRLADGSEEKIELCRLQELSVQQDQNRLVLLERGRMLVLESEKKLDFQGWMSDIQQAACRAGDSLTEQQLTSGDIPVIVERCINFIMQFGLTSQGIYRKCGVNSKISAILESFLQDARNTHLKEGEHHVDDVAGVLKRFFRNVKEGIFTSQGAPNWLHAIEIKEQSQRIAQYQTLLNALPPVNKATLRTLISHLYCIQHSATTNQMNRHNLAIVFGPTLFQTDGTNNTGSRVIEELIQHYVAVFNVSEEQLQKEVDEVNWFMKTNTENFMVRTPPDPGSEMIFTVYLEEAGQIRELHIKVCPTLSAAAMTSEMLEKQSITPQERDYWSSFEVNKTEDTERALHHLEKVFPLLSSGSTLVVKKDDAMETMLTYLASKTNISKYKTMKVREGIFKGFQDRYVTLSGTTIRIYKEAQSVRPERELPVKSLTLYQGIKKKLNPPTRWGLTVVNKQEKRQCYLCCDSETEMREWMSIFMSIQYDGDVWPANTQ